MSSALAIQSRRQAIVVIALCAFAADSRACDTQMICAWQRTFYAYNYLDSPLRAYFMPRTPNCNCWGGPSEPCAVSQPAIPPLPSGMERLGRIPNDFELGAIATGAPPGR